MSQVFKHNSRRLWLSASVLALAVAGPALAQTTVLTPGQNYDLNTATDTVVEVPTGMTAYYNSGVGWALPGGSTLLNYTSYMSSENSAPFNWWNGCCRFNAPVITVDSGATLRFVGQTSVPYDWYSGDPWLNSMINATGDVVFEKVKSGSELELIGTNKFLGNVTLLDGAVVQMGWDWSSINATTTFGPNTHFDLQGVSTLTLNPGGTGVFNGTMAADSTATFFLKSGSLTMNGQSTAFAGTAKINSGATLVVGDSTHSSATLGNAAKTAIINVSSTTASLSGYGTINGIVTNNGVVTAGGTKGVNGNLTINGSYTQASTGQLYTAFSPTGVSGLVVNGNATLAGDLIISIAEGSYGNAVYPLVTVNGGTLSGSFTTVSTNGNVAGAMVGVAKTAGGYSIVTQKGSAAQVFGHLVYSNRTALTNFVGSLYDVMSITPASGAKVDTWITPIGEIENLSRDGQGYEQKTYGLRMGALHRFENHGGVVGAAFSYRHGNMTVKDDPATSSSNGYDFAVYGGADVNALRFEGSAFYNVYDASTKRPMGTYGTAAADQSGYAFGASGQISHDMFGSRLTPYVRGMYARVHLAAASETGSDYYNLRHDALSANTFAVDLGMRVHVMRAEHIKVDADLAWRHDLSDPGETVTGGFVTTPDSSSVAFWKGDSKNAFRAGVNVAGQVTDKLEIYGRLDGTVTSYRRAGELAAGVKYRF
ncbi:autotransporter outer membrane beta-barrel domain-containing protein [Rhizomicrobium electricum]|uniref:Autotransporter domain-containing protein n=1 Tax=Rhizomicrobium electricum TaxID=480070 RepID=A0ABN1FBH9_9PROT|nr:autotransporter outer membrane beta-barrel domain-containing protein [Rhizomicrobium electricum]NIJ50755.1 uncharacterized protein with beta-barrel porin domain [Rhizomicrobium electricum]